jgi:hypothetical protein
MDQPAAGPGFPGDHCRVSAAPYGSEATATDIDFFAPAQAPDPGVTDRMHGFLRSGDTEALIAYARDESIQALAARRERLDS